MQVPPWRQRLAFWFLQERLPEHPQWVEWQIRSGRGAWIRQALLAAPLLLLFLPRFIEGRADGFDAALAVVLVVGNTLSLLSMRRPAGVDHQLRHHAVAQYAGQAPETVRPTLRPFTLTTAALLVVQVVVLATGAGFAVDAHTSPDRCRSVDPAVVAALQVLLDAPLPPPLRQVPELAHASVAGLHPRLVEVRGVAAQQFVTYIAGYVEVDAGTGRRVRGPAVWSAFDLRSVEGIPEPRLSVGAVSGEARQLTPTTSYVQGGLAPRAKQALACARDGR